MLDLSYRHADEILANHQNNKLWIGDLAAAEDIPWLKQNNINTVITVAAGTNLKYDSTIRQIKYDLEDKKTEKINEHFDIAAYQIEKNLRSGSVLVHCGAGVSRSTTLVIAYLIKYKGMSFAAALKLCKTKRPQVCPNLGFQLQLKAYDKKLHQETTQSLEIKSQTNKPFPILKQRQLEKNITNFHRSYYELKEVKGKQSNLTLSKQPRPQKNEPKELQYLKKMAEFRFGITNMERWRINVQRFKKQLKI